MFKRLLMPEEIKKMKTYFQELQHASEKTKMLYLNVENFYYGKCEEIITTGLFELVINNYEKEAMSQYLREFSFLFLAEHKFKYAHVSLLEFNKIANLLSKYEMSVSSFFDAKRIEPLDNGLTNQSIVEGINEITKFNTLGEWDLYRMCELVVWGRDSLKSYYNFMEYKEILEPLIKKLEHKKQVDLFECIVRSAKYVVKDQLKLRPEHYCDDVFALAAVKDELKKYSNELTQAVKATLFSDDLEYFNLRYGNMDRVIKLAG